MKKNNTGECRPEMKSKRKCKAAQHAEFSGGNPQTCTWTVHLDQSI